MEPLHSHRGFTLIELLVVFAIIGVISAVIFTNQNSFNKTIVLANTAYDIALTLRSAETFGLGGHAVGVQPIGYGVHFDKTKPGSLILFADTYPAPSVTSVCHRVTDPAALDAQSGNCVYDAAQNEKVTEYTLGNGITISSFCYFTLLSGWTCSDSTEDTTLDIVFARPNPDALMSVNGTYSASAAMMVTKASLTVSSAQGGVRYISIMPSGAINANAPARTF